MHRTLNFTFLFLAQLLCLGQAQQALLQPPNGTFGVGLIITDMVDVDHLQPFAPQPEPRALAVSIFYPTNSTSTVPMEYMPPETAALEDVEHASLYGLPSPNGTFERLALQLASNGSQISSAAGVEKWPLLLFSGADGTSRLFYNAIASQIASNGFVVVTFDTAYDTDVVEYQNGSIVLANDTLQETEANAVISVNARSQDASFILDQLSNSSLIDSLIPGCNSCLNLNHVGFFGHSIGGATAATVMLNESRIAGGLNFDGALWGDVIEEGLDRPFMMMTRAGHTRASQNQPDNPNSSWFTIWPKLTGPKFGFVLANSMHYTYSDLPIVVETLGIKPNATTMESEQITDLDGARALHIVTSYTTAFFEFVLQGKSSEFLQSSSPLFPEITVDDSPETGTNTSTPTPSASASATTSGSGSNSGATSLNGFELSFWKMLMLATGVALLISR